MDWNWKPSVYWIFAVFCFSPWLFGSRERSMEALKGFDIDAPRWDQSTFMGRLKHFFNITDCRTVLLPDSRLDEAKALVESCRWRNGLIWWGDLSLFFLFLTLFRFLSPPELALFLPAQQWSSYTMPRSCMTRHFILTQVTGWTWSGECHFRCLGVWPSRDSCFSFTGHILFY